MKYRGYRRARVETLPFIANAGVALGAALIEDASSIANSIEWDAAADERGRAPPDADADAGSVCTDDWRGGGAGGAAAVDADSTWCAPDSTFERFCFLERAACCVCGDAASDSRLRVDDDDDDNDSGSD